MKEKRQCGYYEDFKMKTFPSLKDDGKRMKKQDINPDKISSNLISIKGLVFKTQQQKIPAVQLENGQKTQRNILLKRA